MKPTKTKGNKGIKPGPSPGNAKPTGYLAALGMMKAKDSGNCARCGQPKGPGHRCKR